MFFMFSRKRIERKIMIEKNKNKKLSIMIEYFSLLKMFKFYFMLLHLNILQLRYYFTLILILLYLCGENIIGLYKATDVI